MPLPNRRPQLTCYHWHCGGEEFTTVAPDMDEAFEKASREAATRGLHNNPLHCFDSYEYDPTGGDGDED